MEQYIGKISSPFEENQSIDFVRLYLSKEKIEIELSSNKRGYENIKTIFGIFNGFGKVTLVNCRYTGMSTGAGADIKKYSAEYLFKGDFIENPETFYFNRVNILMTGLLDWTNISAINNKLYLEKTLKIEELNAFQIYNSKSFSIEIYSSNKIKSEFRNNQITIKESVGFRIKSINEDLNIWKFLNLIKELKKLFFILSNKDTEIESTTFHKNNELPIELFWDGNNSIGSPSIINLGLKFEDIKPNLNEIIHNWFQKKDLHTSIELILEKTINNKLSRENYFLNNCFSIETYHRRFRNYKLFKKTEFKRIKGKILESIEEPTIRNLVENNLAHLNEPNFRNRLYDFEKDFSSILPTEWIVKDYISKIVKTRNYLVHRSSNKNIFNDFEMLYASIYIESIIKINIYRSLFIDENLLNQLLIEVGKMIKSFFELNEQRKFKE